MRRLGRDSVRCCYLHAETWRYFDWTAFQRRKDEKEKKCTTSSIFTWPEFVFRGIVHICEREINRLIMTIWSGEITFSVWSVGISKCALCKYPRIFDYRIFIVSEFVLLRCCCCHTAVAHLPRLTSLRHPPNWTVPMRAKKKSCRRQNGMKINYNIRNAIQSHRIASHCIAIMLNDLDASSSLFLFTQMCNGWHFECLFVCAIAAVSLFGWLAGGLYAQHMH